MNKKETRNNVAGYRRKIIRYSFVEDKLIDILEKSSLEEQKVIRKVIQELNAKIV